MTEIFLTRKQHDTMTHDANLGWTPEEREAYLKIPITRRKWSIGGCTVKTNNAKLIERMNRIKELVK